MCVCVCAHVFVCVCTENVCLVVTNTHAHRVTHTRTLTRTHSHNIHTHTNTHTNVTSITTVKVVELSSLMYELLLCDPLSSCTLPSMLHISNYCRLQRTNENRHNEVWGKNFPKRGEERGKRRKDPTINFLGLHN